MVRYLRRGAARSVLGLWGGAVLTMIGAHVRGDRWLEQPARDLAAGAACATVALAVRWAARELEASDGTT